MTPFDIANGVAVAVAAVCAFGVPKHQVRAATGMILVVAFNWWFYVMSNEPNHPLQGLWAIGVKLTYDDAWALLDALTASLAAVAGWSAQARWLAIVYAAAMAQVAMHVLYWTFHALPEAQYYDGLNWLFWGILAAFIFAGGKGAKDHIVGFRGVRWLGRMARQMGAFARMVARP